MLVAPSLDATADYPRIFAGVVLFIQKGTRLV
jgi:hypothetical protein